jgi:SAM-dependent methyltransferase
MAKIDFVQERREGRPESVERIEVHPWALGGKTNQPFFIDAGMNFPAEQNILLEIIYTVNGVQFFYTRNFLQEMDVAHSAARLEEDLEQFRQGEMDHFGFGDMLPQTSVSLKRTRSTCQFQISADVGAVVGDTSPGSRMINIDIPYLELEDGIQFMKDLIHELTVVSQGKHPDPAALPDGASDWLFVRQLNQKAYDLVAGEYEENYFSNPLVSELFDEWLAALPAGGNVLDAGCGHGQPVVSCLLDRGLRVRGTDLSPKMLLRAREQFPGVEFREQLISEIRSEAEFDGACSFSSLLYLDPIDLSHSIYRLYRAIKPGGWLFLYAYDTHPDWRGLPYDIELGQHMWSWSYGMEEAALFLEEWGYFQVLKRKNVTTEGERERRLMEWRREKQEEYDRRVKTAPAGESIPLPDLETVPTLPYCYAILARRRHV